jgi:mono/diheme cytochrome c family protein
VAAVCLVCLAGPLASCSKGGESNEGARGLGDVMADVARRFEIAGRAAASNRFELAAYEADELGEIFENDVPHASLPKEGPTAQIPGLAKQFLDTAPPALLKAAQAKDPAAFASAFANTAGQCNACHMSAEKGFIQVPSIPGQAVPVLAPVPLTPPAPGGAPAPPEPHPVPTMR